MGMRRAGRPELEHRQVRTEFEHQRCELRLAMGGEAVRDAPHETYYCQLKCHGPLGESKPFGLLLLLPLVIAPAGAPAPFRWNVALRSRQSRLLRHLHQKDRPALVLPGRRHQDHGRDLGRRHPLARVKRGLFPPSLSTRARLLVIYYLFSSLSYDALAPSPQ